MLYDTLNSSMRSGKAGINIVSAYMIIVATLLRIASTLHADADILVVGSPSGLSSKVPKRLSPSCPCNDLNYYLSKRRGKEERIKKEKEKVILIDYFMISKKASEIIEFVMKYVPSGERIVQRRDNSSSVEA